MEKEIINFKDKLYKFLDLQERELSVCIDIYTKLLPLKIIDSKLSSRISSIPEAKQRLSEVLLTYKIYKKLPTKLNSSDSGPDLVFEIDNVKLNIEIVTPCVVNIVQVPATSFTLSSDNQRSERSNIQINVADSNHFLERVSGALTKKIQQFTDWISTGIVNVNDINIICINVGFYENLLIGEENEISKILYDQELISLDVSEEKTISAEVVPFTTILNKTTGKKFKASFLDNGMDGVDLSFLHGVLIYRIGGTSELNNKGMFYPNGSIEPKILDIISANKHSGDYLSNYIRQYGTLPPH